MNPGLTFYDHIRELRRCLMWSLLFVAIGAGVGYFLHDRIVWLLQQPLGEQLYYTTPTGAFSFIIKVCCVFGLVVALPMILYQIFGFFEPLISLRTRRSILRLVIISFALACAGISFAYFISLPAALHFLVNFGDKAGDIQALITADEYFNFVLAYIAGFAVLFQLPLIIAFINRITPLKPSQLFGITRYVILGSFIVSAIITPTPDPLNQTLMALPIIFLYFVSALMVVVVNHKSTKNRKKNVAATSANKKPLTLIDDKSMDRLVNDQNLYSPNQEHARRASDYSTPQRRVRAQPISDIVQPRRESIGTTQAMYQKRPISQSSARGARPNRRLYLISDFIPATD